MAKIKGINTDSRTVNSLKNISSGVVSQIIFTILGFVSRTIFIKYLAIEYLGINGLFSSILSVLSFAELGMGSAFVYSLYKPLAEKDEAGVASVLRPCHTALFKPDHPCNTYSYYRKYLCYL